MYHWIDPPKNSQNFVEKAHYFDTTPLNFFIRTHSIPACIWTCFVPIIKYFLMVFRYLVLLVYFHFTLLKHARYFVCQLCILKLTHNLQNGWVSKPRFRDHFNPRLCAPSNDHLQIWTYIYYRRRLKWSRNLGSNTAIFWYFGADLSLT